MGNISLQGREEAPAPVVAPAESETDRTERAAESDFEWLEVGAFEPHAAKVPRPPGQAAARGVDGDAPAAGDGAQVKGDQQQE